MESVELRGLLPSLPFLVALADTGQVTAAADLLRLPQPTVTRGLQRLERELGVTLVEKAGRGIRLTPAGDALVPFARESLRQAAAGVTAVRAPVRGVVSIAFQNMLGQDLVPALIRAFLSENPQVDFALQQGARQLCLDALRSGRADCALLSPVPSGPEYDVVDLGADELVVVVGPQHPLAHRRTVRIPELATERVVVLGRGFGLRETAEALFAEAGIAPEVAFEAQDIHTMVGLASAGLGVTIVPRRVYSVPVVALTIRGTRAERRVGAATWAGGAAAAGAAAVRGAAVRGAAVGGAAAGGAAVRGAAVGTGASGATSATSASGAAGAFAAFVRRSGPAIASGILARSATGDSTRPRPRPRAGVGGSH